MKYNILKKLKINRPTLPLTTLLFMLACVSVVKAQETLTVYDGGKNPDEYAYVPMDPYNFNKVYTKSQHVIPASDLKSMTGGTISSIKYYYDQKVNFTTSTEFIIYMKEVNYTEFQKNGGFEAVSDNNLVFKGTISFVNKKEGEGTVVITLDKPYTYNGGNLLISVENTEKKSGKYITFFGKKVKSNRKFPNVAVFGTSSTSTSDIAITDIAPKEFIPKTTFTYTSTPEITKVEATPNSATVTWTGKSDNYLLRYAKVELFDDFENGLDKWKTVRNGEGVIGSDWYQKEGCFNDNVAPHSGTHTAVSRSWANQDYDVDNWLISPQVTLGGTLKFWVRDDGTWHEYYEVLVSTTTQDISAFECVAKPGNASAVWTEITVDLSKYAGQKGYFAIRNKDKGQNYLQIDDICLYPKDISWTEVKDVTSPCVIDNLDGATTYFVQVKGVYSSGAETAWATASFTTEDNPVPYDVTVTSATAHTADLSWKGYGDSYEVHYRKGAIHIIMYQGFENGLEDWTLQNCHAKTGPNTNTNAVHGGNVGFAFRYTTTPPQYLISSRIPDTTDGTKLLFYYKNLSDPEKFQVGYSKTSNETSAFTFGNEITISNNQWTIFNEDVPADTKYICIKHTSDNQNYLFVDDIVVYKPGVEGEWQTIDGITGTSTTITGLEADTEYEFQVRSIKATKAGDGASEWNESKTFKTALELLTLLDNDASAAKSNVTILSESKGRAFDVKQSDRTLVKDDSWNTLCLPFALGIEIAADGHHFDGTPLEGATVMELDLADDGTYTHPTGLDGQTLYLNFKEATTIVAGKPYIVKWAGDGTNNLVGTEFKGVIIDNVEPTAVTFTGGKFVGQYSTFTVANDKEIVYLGSKDSKTGLTKIGYAKKGKVLRAFRAHFDLSETLSAPVYDINMNFDGETTSVSEELRVKSEEFATAKEWYTLDGRRLDVQPTQKGVYIYGNKKVVVK